MKETREMKRKRNLGCLTAWMLSLCFFISIPLLAKAQEALEVSQFNQLMVASEQVDALEEPEEGAAVVVTFQAGDPVYVTGVMPDGWYQISYQGKTGYIGTGLLEEQSLDVAALDQEMKKMEEESHMVIDEVERYRAEAKRSKIWGTVIILLVIGIFATGIASTVSAEKKKRKEAGDAEKEAENEMQEDAAQKSDSEIIDLDRELE